MISIIIPTYNRGNLISETLDSILNQTYHLWECIIVDDGSTDNSEEVINNYVNKDSRFQYHKRPSSKPKGANSCRNYGFELSQGEFVHFFDSDDIMHVEHLQKKSEKFTENEDIDFCICENQSFEGEFLLENLGKPTKNVFTDNIYEDYVIGRCSILMIVPTWKRKVLMQTSLFDETLFQSQDLDLYSKILLKFTNVGILPEVLIYVRRNNDSITTKNGRLNIHIDSFLEVKKRVIMQSPNNHNISRALIKMVLQIFRYELANKNYVDCKKCLEFINTYNYNRKFQFKLALLRINFFYKVFKILGRGDTKFKPLLKL